MTISQQTIQGSTARLEQNEERCEGIPPACAADSRYVMNYSAALTSDVHRVLKSHLLRSDGQEDLCYALWRPGQGAHRLTAFITDPILPREGERLVHGNASTTGEYLGRAIQEATEKRHRRRVPSQPSCSGMAGNEPGRYCHGAPPSRCC